MNYDELALELHKKYRGKITTALRDNDLDATKLAAYYTPGVAAVSRRLVEHPEELPVYTWTNNLVAIISDGSAVLGLGNIGPRAAMPVMEGKSLLFKHFAGIDSVPIVLDVHGVDEIVAAVKAIAPSFGAINLEDIAAPQCFAIEERLKAELPIPVMHDDQHGTAIVVLAGLINALKVTGRSLAECRVVVVGAGAAGTAIMRLIAKYGKAHDGAPEILAVDSRGIVSGVRDDLNAEKRELLEFTNPHGVSGALADAVAGADIFVGVSKGGLLTPELVATMADAPIVFALANPTPEIMPETAAGTKIAVLATGRSDFPNQVNNALAFPGIFRGALDHHIRAITDEHKLAAAEAIAALVESPDAARIIPSVFDERLVAAVAKVIV